MQPDGRHGVRALQHLRHGLRDVQVVLHPAGVHAGVRYRVRAVHAMPGRDLRGVRVFPDTESGVCRVLRVRGRDVRDDAVRCPERSGVGPGVLRVHQLRRGEVRGVGVRVDVEHGVRIQDHHMPERILPPGSEHAVYGQRVRSVQPVRGRAIPTNGVQRGPGHDVRFLSDMPAELLHVSGVQPDVGHGMLGVHHGQRVAVLRAPLQRDERRCGAVVLQLLDW